MKFPEIVSEYDFDNKPDNFFIYLLSSQSPMEIATSIARDQPRKVVDLCHFFYELKRQLEASDDMFREEYRVKNTVNYTFGCIYEYFPARLDSGVEIVDPTALFIRAEIGSFTNHHLRGLCEGIESGFTTRNLISPHLKDSSVKTIVVSLRKSQVSDPELVYRLSAISSVLYIDVMYTRVAAYFESNPSSKVIVSTAKLSDECIETCNKYGHYVQR